MNPLSTDDQPTDTDDRPAPATPKKSLRTKLAAGLVAVALLAGGGFALTQLGGSSTSSTAAGPGAGGAGGAGRPGGGAGFGGGQAPTSGTISAVSATSISVQTTSGTSTYKVADATVVQNNGATSTASKLTVGEQVIVFAGAAPGSSTTTSADTANRILAGSSATMPTF
jgi:hypothetical protein